VDGCSVELCTWPPPPDGGPPTVGDLTLQYETTNESMSPNAYGYELSGNGLLWAAGSEPVTIAATGGEVPPFAISVPAPGYIDVSAPTFPENAAFPMVIPTNVDLVAAWSGGEPGADVVVRAEASGDVIVECRFPIEALSGAVPAVALQQIATRMGSLFIYAETSSKQDLQGGQLSLAASSFGKVSTSELGSVSMHVLFE
jgi:hypothetical protein